MKSFLLFFALLLWTIKSYANQQDSAYYFNLPDSVDAVSFIATMNTGTPVGQHWVSGIAASGFQLQLETRWKNRQVSFLYPEKGSIVAAGLKVLKQKKALIWRYQWPVSKTYKLLIAAASDSAQNFALYSGYIYFPEDNLWKLIGTVRLNGQWSHTIQKPAALATKNEQKNNSATVIEAWVQRAENKGWKPLISDTATKVPVLVPMPNRDSLAQFTIDKELIEKAIKNGKLEQMQETEGVYYFIIDPGHGAPITLTDSITAHYQLHVFNDGSLVDNTHAGEGKAPSFRLNRLIKGWQLAIPKIKEGGKVKIIIPSGLAYSIRTRSAKIPPNSILEFEVEVLKVIH